MEDPDCMENTLAISAANVKSKLEKFLCLLSSCLTLAAVLDPRSNLLYFEKYYNNLLEYGKIKNQIQSIYASRYASVSNAVAIANTTENNGAVLNEDSVLNEIFNFRESNPMKIPFCGGKIMSMPTLLSLQWPKITYVLLVHPLLVKEYSLLRSIQYKTTGHPF
jgi:hypothetical protein